MVGMVSSLAGRNRQGPLGCFYDAPYIPHRSYFFNGSHFWES